MSAPEQAKAAGAQTIDAPSLLDQVIKATRPQDKREADRAKDVVEQFVKQALKPDQLVSKDVEKNLKYWIEQIDQKLSAQVNEIIHHEKFQKLEASWRGLKYLLERSETGENLKIRVFNVTKRELLKDAEDAAEFDQSVLFKKVYEAEYGTLGGTPYGLLIGNYEFGRGSEDVTALRKIAGVAAQAHAPFVSAADPGIMGLESYTELVKPRDLAKIFATDDYAQWRDFRDSEESRYVALTLPHVLCRLPYGNEYTKVDAFNFEENVDGKDHSKFLWMNAAWAYAARITDAYSKYGWMARTRGVEGGGKVEELPVFTFKTDDGEIAMKCPTEVELTDRREYELSNLGFLPLCHNKRSNWAVFMGAQSCQKPKKYFDNAANANAELSTKINFILCVSRFAHYFKVLGRNWIGSSVSAKEVEDRLNYWLSNYTTASPELLGDEGKAKTPLSASEVRVSEIPGRPGHYQAVAFLKPHFQMDSLDLSMSLVAEIPPKPK